MTTDRELLEKAAKAAGIEHEGEAGDWLAGRGNLALLIKGTQKVWNPLTDDGDALRLAVKLGFSLSIGTAGCMVRYERPPGDLWIEERRTGTDQDIPAATRRAIVRAAASIAKEEA